MNSALNRNVASISERRKYDPYFMRSEILAPDYNMLFGKKMLLLISSIYSLMEQRKYLLRLYL